MVDELGRCRLLLLIQMHLVARNRIHTVRRVLALCIVGVGLLATA